MNNIQQIFPDIKLNDKDSFTKQNLQIQTYGRRIKKDQTVPEYLLEFLLMFIGEQNGKSGFDKFNYDDDKFLGYKVNPHIGLKRFIFFENSKLENRFDVDKDAYEKLRSELSKSIKAKNYYQDDILDIIQELFYGFSAVTKNRGWFAQSMMPICKETIFPEAMGKKSQREKLNFNDKSLKVDNEFEFKEHNFMARGGEVYYLHLMQGLKDNENLKNNIQSNINRLINSYPQMSIISNWINSKWYDTLKSHIESNKDIELELQEEIDSKWITKRYERRSKYTVKELNNLLISETSEFEKIDLLNTAIVIQVLRMMVESSKCIVDDVEECNPMWLVHIPSTSPTDNKIKKLAVEEYKNIEECMELSISKVLLKNKEAGNEDIGMGSSKKTKSDLSKLKKANEDSFKLLRKIGKDIGLVIPLRGENMRFAMNDSIIRFLVLSLVEPETKITLKRFLKKLYEHFGIVIGPEEYYQYISENNLSNVKDVSFLNYNLIEFQNLLRKNGFLRELSDAMSIVENPYKKVEELVDAVVCTSN